MLDHTGLYEIDCLFASITCVTECCAYLDCVTRVTDERETRND